MKKKSDEEESDDEENEEEIMRNLVSTHGKVGSFIIDNNLSKDKQGQADKNLLRASQIRKHKSFLGNEESMGDVFKRVTTKQELSTSAPGEIKSNNQEAQIKQSSELTPYLLLAALSFHGLFEGIALGLQRSAKATISLALAILAHKWAEALTLGLSFAKSQTEKSTFFKMISIFSVFTPAGIGLGMLLSSFPEWVTSSFMSLSVGTFIYIGAAEIVVEEFSISRYKWLKYFVYLLGALFIAGLTIWEVAGADEE